MPPSIACAKAGVTTGEWGFALRSAFGEYRAPTGVGTAMRNDAEGLDDIRAEVDRVSKKLGRRLKFLVGKPGLDGHSNGAEQIAARARDAGMDVVYDGIRLTAEAIAAAAAEKDVHVVGLSILSGSHLPLVHDVIARMKEAGIDDVPVVVGGIIPQEDASALKEAGVAAVYTPKDFELNRIMTDVVRIVESTAAKAWQLFGGRRQCHGRSWRIVCSELPKLRHDVAIYRRLEIAQDPIKLDPVHDAMIVKDLNLGVAVRLDQAIIQHECGRHRRLGDGAAGRKRIDPGDADIFCPQRARPIERQAPDQPAHETGRRENRMRRRKLPTFSTGTLRSLRNASSSSVNDIFRAPRTARRTMPRRPAKPAR